MNTPIKPLKIYKASAGSGKTFRLAVEYIALLVKAPTEYQHILAVTFTNKATGEMKQRIISQLYGIANAFESSQGYVEAIIELLNQEGYKQADGSDATPEFVKSQCVKALNYVIHDYSNFRIVTIDSFFQSIVRELANELGLAANISVELDSNSVLEKAVDEIIDNLSLTSPEYHSIVRYIESQLEDTKNWKINENIINFGSNILQENYLIKDEEIKREISKKENLDAYKVLVEKHLATQTEILNTRLSDIAKKAILTIENSSVSDSIASYPKNFFNKDWANVDKWEKGMEEYTTIPAKWAKKSKKEDETVLAHIVDNFIPLAQELKDTFLSRLSLENDVKAVKAHLYDLMIIGKINEQMNLLNKENNRFLLAETAHFLNQVINHSNIPFIYEKTGTKINHIMIDEFQDTSTMQWQNFRPLLENCLDMGQSCLIVGDVKQSIYRFRNSDWQILNNIDGKESDMLHYVEKIEHDVNHRSSPRVIDFNNQLFTHTTQQINNLYQEEYGHDCVELDTAYSTVAQKSSEKEQQYGYVQIDNIILPKEDKKKQDEEADAPQKEDAEAMELRHIMQNVKALIDSGVEKKDIAILVRTRDNATAICQYFETHKDELNVDIISDEAFKLEASPVVRIIIYALRALSALQDKLHLTTLAYYYQTLVLGNETVKNNSSLIFLTDEETLLSKYLPATFAKARNTLRFKSIAEIVEEVYDMFHLDQLPQQDAYMFFFQDIVETYSRDKLADIDSFLTQWNDELYKKTIPNGNTDGIRLMTIHKSKGLEFHTVIMPFCNWSLTPKDTTLLWCEPTAEPFARMPLLPIDYRYTGKSTVFADDRKEEELLTLVDNVNIIYVGLTRAVHNLIVISTSKEDNPRFTADKLIIDSVESAINAKTNPLLMHKDTTDDGACYTYGSIVSHSGPEKKEKTTPAKKEENPLTRLYDEQPVKFVSNSTMAEFRQSNDSDLFISSQSDNERAQKHAERIRLISLGNLYHNTLQLINTNNDIHSAILQMERRGCFERLAGRDEVERNTTQLIDNVSLDHPEWFSPDWRAINERAILFADDDGTPCQKRPDRVIVQGNKAIVIDYKTAVGTAVKLPDGTLSVPSENVKQVEKYCSLLHEIGYAEVEGYLWYILDGIIHKVQS